MWTGDKERPAPRVARETRRLLAIVFISIATLWVLARIRFPDQPPPRNPVQPVLAQLPPQPPLNSIASSLADLQARVARHLVAVERAGMEPGGTQAVSTGLRFRDDLAIVFDADPNHATPASTEDRERVAADPASGLTLVRVAPASAPVVQVWTPPRTPQPRFFVVAQATSDAVLVQPVLLGSFSPLATPLWTSSVWDLPAHTAVETGGFVFTTDGSLVGAVVEWGGRRAIVPGDQLLEAAERLLTADRFATGWLGIDVSSLTPAVAGATGASQGVIVTRVDRDGPAADLIRPTDVVEALNGEPLATLDHWTVPIARLKEGDAVRLRIRRQAASHDVEMIAASVRRPIVSHPLGLEVRSVRGRGVEVVRVQPGSAGSRARLQPGDLITVVGPIDRPSRAQLVHAYEDPDRQPLVAAVTRGDTHLVVALEKQW